MCAKKITLPEVPESMFHTGPHFSLERMGDPAPWFRMADWVKDLTRGQITQINQKQMEAYSQIAQLESQIMDIRARAIREITEIQRGGRG
jgi:hypothetical protein